MYKLVVLSAVFAVALARPGYLHGHDLVSISVPRPTSHQSRVEIHSNPIISYNEHLHGVDLQAIALNDNDFHHGHDDNLEAITIDADIHQDNLHEVAGQFEDDVLVTYPEVHSQHVVTPIVHSVDAVHSVPVYSALNTRYISSPIENSEDVHQVYSVDNHHLSGDVVHGSVPVYNALNTQYVSSPLVHSEDAHQVYSVDNHQVAGDVVLSSANTQYLFSPTVNSEDVHQVYSVDDHVSGDVIHSSAPVYHALDSQYVSSPLVHSEDVLQVSPVHSVEAVHVPAPVVAASSIHYAAPAVVSHSSKETVSSHELHQVHGAPAVHHAVSAVHLDHEGHLVPVVQAVHSAPSAVSHSSRTDVVKSSSSVLQTPVAHHEYPELAVHAW